MLLTLSTPLPPCLVNASASACRFVTARARGQGALDNPVTDECHWVEAASNPFLEGVLTLDELIEHVSG